MSEVHFNNNYNNYDHWSKETKQDKKPETTEEKAPVQAEQRNVSPEKMMDAMNALGVLFSYSINTPAIKTDNISSEIKESVETFIGNSFEAVSNMALEFLRKLNLSEDAITEMLPKIIDKYYENEFAMAE